MNSRVVRVPVVVSMAAGALVLSGAVATAADTNVGEAFSPTDMCASNTTYLNTVSGTPSYTVPSAGVITSIRIPGDPSTASTRAFKLGRGSGTTWTIVGSTDPTAIAAGQTLVQNVRIPTRAGDVLGVYVGGNDSACAKSDNSYTNVYVNDNAGEGTTFTGTAESYPMSVDATVEPDTDGDGYGDTTQDRCPTQAGTHDLCRLSFGSVGTATGTAKVGKKLAAPHLTLPSGARESFQWYRLVKVHRHHHTRTVARGISGAHNATYELKHKDKHKKVFVHIRVSAPGYQTGTVNSLPRKVS